MTTVELIVIVGIATLFLLALCAIVIEEGDEFNYFKVWNKEK